MLTWGDTKYAQQQGDVYNEQFPDAPTTLNVSSGGDNDSDSLEKFRLALSSGQDVPDIVQMNYSSVAEFAEAGVLADVQPYVEQYLDGITPAGAQLMQYNGQYVAFPYEVKSKLWFYRKDLFEQAGIDVTDVKTQADFIAAGQQLQAVSPNSYMWNIGPNIAAYDLGMILSGNGATFSQKDPCQIVIDTDQGVEDGFSALKELRDSGVVNTQLDDFTPEWQTALADGTIASTLLASWFPTFLQEYAPDLGGKWGVTTWPEIGGAAGGSEAGGSVFVIPANAPHKDAAAAFLAGTLLDPDGAQAYVTARGGVFPSAVTAVLDSDGFRNSEYYGEGLADAFVASTGSDFSVFPYDPAALKEQGVVQAQLVNFLASTDTSPESYLQTAQQEVESQVGCPFQAQ